MATTKAKTIVKRKLSDSNWVSTAGAGVLEEISRAPILDIYEIGGSFGRVYLTKPRLDENGENIPAADGTPSGGKPQVWLHLPQSILDVYEVDGDSINLSFHTSAKNILAETGNKLADDMDLVELKNTDTDEYSFMITGADVNVTSSQTEEKDIVRRRK